FVNYKGKRKAKRVGVGKDGKKAADLAKVKIQARLAEGGDLSALAGPAPGPTVKGDAGGWLAAGAGLACRGSALRQDRHRRPRRLFPPLAPLPPTAITRDRIKGLIAAEFTNGKPAPRTVGGFVTTLGAVLNSAVEDGLIASNPALRLGKVIRRDQMEVEQI